MKVINAVGSFFRFWYAFIVGDDWTVVASIAAALIVTAALNQHGIAAWWVVPSTVVVAVGNSLRRASVSPVPTSSGPSEPSQ